MIYRRHLVAPPLLAVLAISACGDGSRTQLAPSSPAPPSTATSTASGQQAVPSTPPGTASTTSPSGLSRAKEVLGTGTSGVPSLPFANRTTSAGNWRLAASTEFTGTALPADVYAYTGHPASTDKVTYSPSNVTVSGGHLTIRAAQVDGQWISGGLEWHPPVSGPYGKYTVRFRMDKAHGIGYALMLWPSSEKWPVDGEIDFAEDAGGDRSRTRASLVYGVNSVNSIKRELAGDFSTWHTLGVEWSPGKLAYTVDGRVWGTVVSAAVPTTAHHIAIQTGVSEECSGTGVGCPDGTTPGTVNLQIDSMAAYSRA